METRAIVDPLVDEHWIVDPLVDEHWIVDYEL